MATLCSGSGTVTGAGVATARVTRDARERRAGATCRVRRVTPLRSEGGRGPDASASGASRVACGARGRTRCVRGGGWICEGNDSHLATTLLLAAPEDLARAWRRSPAELTMVAAIVRVVTRCLTLTKGRLDEVMTSRREFVHRRKLGTTRIHSEAGAHTAADHVASEPLVRIGSVSRSISGCLCCAGGKIQMVAGGRFGLDQSEAGSEPGFL